MVIEIPSNYYPFQLNMFVESKDLIKLRIVAYDPNKPSTKYLDRVSKLNGKRKYELKFPVAPQRLKIAVFNVANGSLPYGEDSSFELADLKVDRIKEYDVWWNADTRNFYKFAVEFSQNASILSAGESKPHIYRSDDGKFTIDYYNNIIDKKSNKKLTTPARIGHNTGIIEVSKSKFMNYSVPMRILILMHEYAHKYLNPKIGREISYETGADIQSLYFYLGKGWSPYEAHKTYLQVFRNANNKSNHKRYKIIDDFIKKYENGQVSNEIKMK
jgi:hypothetical protein